MFSSANVEQSPPRNTRQAGVYQGSVNDNDSSPPKSPSHLQVRHIACTQEVATPRPMLARSKLLFFYIFSILQKHETNFDFEDRKKIENANNFDLHFL